MEHLSVTNNRSYKHGFVLNETELRRLIDLANEQFKKQSENIPVYQFEIKFKNGAVARTSDIEAVFRQQNDTSSLIVRLIVTGILNCDEGISEIQYIFKNIVVEDDDHIPIRHKIESYSKDWVFITSSLIEERVAKIKRLEVANIDKRHPLWVRFIPILAVYILLVISVLQFSINASQDNVERSRFLNQLEAKWKSKKISDSVEIILEIEKHEAKLLSGQNRSPGDRVIDMVFNKYMVVFIVLVIGTFLSFWVSNKVYPSYNFVWGGYVDDFNRKEAVSKLIFTLVFITVILGIVLNLLSNYIWKAIE